MKDKIMIIINADNEYGDLKLFDFFRTFNVPIITGICDWCVYYIFDDEEVGGIFKKDSSPLGKFIKGNYKIENLPNTFFECNCQDTDLPMIEDVWSYVKAKGIINEKYEI